MADGRFELHDRQGFDMEINKHVVCPFPFFALIISIGIEMCKAKIILESYSV